MTQEVAYEVHVQQGGRWSIHARFQGHQKDDAIDEGKGLDKLPNVEAVKVIKEVFDIEREVHNEFIVYKSSTMKSADAEKTGGGGGASAGYGAPAQRRETWVAEDDDDGLEFEGASPSRGKGGKKGKKKGSSLTTILVKLLMVLLFSVVIAAIAAAMVSEIFHGAKVFGVRIVGNAESNLLIGTFVVTFLVSAVGLAVKIMSGEKLEESKALRIKARQDRAKKAQAKAKKPAPEAKKKPGQPGQPAAPSSQAGKDDDTLTNLEDAMKGINEAKAAESQQAKTQEDAEVTARLQGELNKDKEGAKADEAQGKGAVLSADQVAKPPPQPEPLSPQAEKQKARVMEFLSKALEGQGDQKLDNFNKFGVNLYLAGACEVMAQKNNLGVLDRSRILGDCVQVMGFKKSHAASFADRYEEYLMADSRYMQMFQAGRNAMNIHTTDADEAPRLMNNALEEWNKPKQKEEQAGPITVLFTDIAGSTAMTQNLGDAGAQQVVRAHNRIVREALSTCAGKEIKHTGDGIMASFNKTSDGVDAAIQMQRETMTHNQNNPDLPLHLKIGLNAGEPIAEDNDLFGTTVQLSARIVDKASADEIFVSEIVRGICAGKEYTFVNKGGFPMKGFGDDITLYEVVWADGGGAPAQPDFAPSTAPAAAPPPADGS